MRSRLASAAEEWVHAGHDVGFLLSAGRLQLFESWAASTDLGLGTTDQEFLEASLAEHRRQEEVDASRAAHERKLERRATSRLRALVAVFATAALVAVILSLVVLGQQRTAREQEAIASARELAAASVGTLGADPQLSLLLAIEAAGATAERGFVVEEAMDALHLAAQESQIPYPDTDAPVAIRAAPGGPMGVFLLPPDQLAQHAADRTPRQLSVEECRTFLHQEPCPETRGWEHEQLDVYTEDGRVPVERLANGSLEGAEIRVVAEFDGSPGRLVAEFAADTGIEVEWLSGNDGADLATRIGEGERPDVALVSRPGVVSSLVEEGHLIDMNVFLDRDRIVAGLDDYLAELTAGVGGGLHGVPWAVSVSSLIWYPVPEFEEAGYRIPETWDELMALSERMVADGRTPWCLGVEAGADSGAVATDWVEDLVLRAAGPEAYDQWVAHRTSFRSPHIRDAFQRFGEVAFGEGFVLGDSASISNIPRDVAAWPMFLEPPKCWLHRDGGESTAHLPQPGAARLGAFPFPAVDPQFSDMVMGRVYMIMVFRDRPEVREFVEYLLTQDAAVTLASTPPVEGLLPARAVDSSLYRDEMTEAQDDLLRAALEAETFRVDASDLMSPQIGSTEFARGLLTYLTWGEASLDQVLAESEEAWR